MYGGEIDPRGLQAITEKSPDEMKAHRRNLPLRWANEPDKQSRQFSVTNLFPRILYTFSHVIVFVVREIKTFESEILQMLVEWASGVVDKSVNKTNKPHVIIAINACDTLGSSLDTEQLLHEYRDSFSRVPKLQAIVDDLKKNGIEISSTGELLGFYYSSVQVVHIPSASHQRYMELDEKTTDLYDAIREKCYRSFSEKRLARIELNRHMLLRFMTSAYDHFSRHLDKPFDFVTEALHHNPMPQGFEGHVLNLILMIYTAEMKSTHASGADSLDGILGILSPQMASCVMLAATRENYKCSYDRILRHNFHQAIRRAFDQFINRWLRCGFRSGDQVCCLVKISHQGSHQDENGKYFSDPLSDGGFSQRINPDAAFDCWMERIEVHLDRLKRKMNLSGDDRVETGIVWLSHRDQVESFYKKHPSLDKAITHATCLICVNQIPTHVLPCGHVLCDDCVLALGEKARDGSIELSYCPLHSTRSAWRPEESPFRIRFKPPEAGTRVLCLDGGGVRGIVELVILQALEDELLGIPIRNFFDLIVGTSTGGIIALGLGVKNWSLDTCIDKFKTLCTDGFKPRLFGTWKKSAPFFSMFNSIYKTQPLESALQAAFDAQGLLFGPRSNREAPFVRVAVTTTGAIRRDAAIFTNYNGDSADREKHHYQLLREQGPLTEIKVWEAARATSAAPRYFKPFSRQGTGDTFIDGAINHNCPIRIAHHEQRLIRSNDEERPPDILISLGTGLETLPEQTKATTPPTEGQKTTGFRFRWRVAFDMVDKQLDTEATWRDYQDRIPPRHGMKDVEDRRRHMRINVEFPKGDSRPGLDAIGKLKYLEDEARTACKSNVDIKEAAHRLVASCFYFETNKSRREHEINRVVFHGAIKCRLEEESDIQGLGKFLRNCIKPFQGFKPSFLLQPDYVPSSAKTEESMNGSVIPIPSSTLDFMVNFGAFHLPFDKISLPVSIASKPIRMSIRLQKDHYHQYNGRFAYFGTLARAEQSPPYLSISGFPRVVLSSDKGSQEPSTLSGFQITHAAGSTSPVSGVTDTSELESLSRTVSRASLQSSASEIVEERPDRNTSTRRPKRLSRLPGFRRSSVSASPPVTSEYHESISDSPSIPTTSGLRRADRRTDAVSPSTDSCISEGSLSSPGSHTASWVPTPRSSIIETACEDDIGDGQNEP
ncbi:hypothetical protein QBC37DRAFT_12053 [Rhypophila decipiens]|uniref:FabD/lysophospholipase-like protein n=1 Tax=Rhypophila decipiens TaxID=261697 RepID=A0AAN6Y528_9PEZI|nr:hypothetical protein QBC37DRAFT_12053 [Rhypophila decipiens]